MVAEALPKSPEAVPLVLGLQPAALIDNVAPVDWSLLDRIPGDRGGSIPVSSSFCFLCAICVFDVGLGKSLNLPLVILWNGNLDLIFFLLIAMEFGISANMY